MKFLKIIRNTTSNIRTKNTEDLRIFKLLCLPVWNFAVDVRN